MKKIKSERWIIFFILYILFTAACSCVSLIFPAHQILVIQVWYQISVVVWIFLAKPNGFTKKIQTLYIVNLDFIRESYGKKHKRSPYQKVEIFIQKLNINGLHRDIQKISER